jgi:hypothetical protein
MLTKPQIRWEESSKRGAPFPSWASMTLKSFHHILMSPHPAGRPGAHAQGCALVVHSAGDPGALAWGSDCAPPGTSMYQKYLPLFKGLFVTHETKTWANDYFK